MVLAQAANHIHRTREPYGSRHYIKNGISAVKSPIKRQRSQSFWQTVASQHARIEYFPLCTKPEQSGTEENLQTITCSWRMKRDGILFRALRIDAINRRFA